MSTMKAVLFTGPGECRWTDVPRPVPGAGEVLVRVKATGICGSDMELFRGSSPLFAMGLAKYPLIPGHEWSGVVEGIGADVTLFHPGDRVTGDVSIGCLRCVNCKRGHYHLCESRREVGIMRGKDGAFADFLIMPEPFVYRLPDGIGFDAAALTEPAATMVKSIRRTPVSLGDIALVLGAGPIGLLGLQAVKAAGAGCAIMVSRSAMKLNLARQVGADVVVNAAAEDVKAVVRELTRGRGVDYCIEASGAPSAMAQAASLVRDGGTINTVGIYESAIPGYDMSDVVLRDITVVGSVASANAWEATLRLMAAGRIRTEPCISHRFPLSEVAAALKLHGERAAERIKVILNP